MENEQTRTRFSEGSHCSLRTSALRWPDRLELVGPTVNQSRRTTTVNDVKLINITDSASQALAAFDWSEHEGKGIRLFVQGFG